MKSNSLTFVDISAVRENFFIKIYAAVKQTIYTLPLSLVEICRKMTKLCCFNQGNPNFSAF